MASELYVETLKGLTSGANANKVIVPAGQTLEVTDGLRSADMPTGSTLQVKQVVTGSEFYTTSTSPTDTGFSITVTPTSSTSSILISLAGGRLNPSDGGVHVQVRRNTTEITSNIVQRSGFGSNGKQLPLSYEILDTSHGTTSAITYRVYAWVPNGGSVAINNGNSQNFTITAVEYAG